MVATNGSHETHGIIIPLHFMVSPTSLVPVSDGLTPTISDDGLRNLPLLMLKLPGSHTACSQTRHWGQFHQGQDSPRGSVCNSADRGAFDGQ